MKKIELISLHLTNFKGTKNRRIEANGQSLNIFGANGSGKTTIPDAFSWLLFGKDSLNRTENDFDIKLLDKNGKVIHGLDHQVEGVFKWNGQKITLKRVYKEKWQKKSNNINKVFSGHTTKYFIDDLAVKKKEYEEQISNMIPDDVFKLITNPLYFHKNLHHTERKEILMNIAGEVTLEEVAQGDEELEGLLNRLNGKEAEKKQLQVRQQKKEINEELERIPIRIDEINRSLPDINGLDEQELNIDIDLLDQKIDKKNEQIQDIKNGSEIINKRNVLSNIDLDISNIKNSHEQGNMQKVYQLRTALQEEQSNIHLLESKINNLKQEIEMNNKRKSDLETDIEVLRKEWTETNQQEFKHDDECICPTCEQELPQERVEEARQKALENFNEKKAEDLENITSTANKKKEEVEKVNALIDRTNARITDFEKEIQDKKTKTENKQSELEELESQVTDLTENADYIAKMKEKEEVEKEIIQLKESVNESVEEVQKEISTLEDTKKELQGKINELDLYKKYESRLQELYDQEKDLASEFERLEHEDHLIDTLLKKKVEHLEDKINSKFKMAKFKLFDEKINGKLVETCEAVYDGVPFTSGLNDASKINVGLDIINVLTEHYGVVAPIFIDNRESVTDLIETKSQVISLIVSKQHKDLTIENENTKKIA